MTVHGFYHYPTSEHYENQIPNMVSLLKVASVQSSGALLFAIQSSTLQLNILFNLK